MPVILLQEGVNQPIPSESRPPFSGSDVEKQTGRDGDEPIVNDSKSSTFKSLGWLDRFLALWIFLAMAIGIILANFVPSTEPALQKGSFVGVSIPLGMFHLFTVAIASSIFSRMQER